MQAWSSVWSDVTVQLPSLKCGQLLLTAGADNATSYLHHSNVKSTTKQMIITARLLLHHRVGCCVHGFFCVKWLHMFTVEALMLRCVCWWSSEQTSSVLLVYSCSLGFVLLKVGCAHGAVELNTTHIGYRDCVCLIIQSKLHTVY